MNETQQNTERYDRDEWPGATASHCIITDGVGRIARCADNSNVPVVAYRSYLNDFVAG